MKFSFSPAGSSALLAQFASLYFFLYCLYGLLVKIFQGSSSTGLLGFNEAQFLVYSTFGSAVVCLGVIFGAGWWKAKWSGVELTYIVASGTFTAIVIPTTTLMYSLPISVMVAMVLMRGSIIVVSRLVDAILIAQKISSKRVEWEENAAVLIAISAVSLNIAFARARDFDFLQSRTAMAILTVYILAYALRIYLMNYFKFTRSEPKIVGASTIPGEEIHRQANHKNYFALEQLTASVCLIAYLGVCLSNPHLLPGSSAIALSFSDPHPKWTWAVLAGIPFGLSAFFSAFLFLFKGRSSTFSGLANRLSSLLAGTISTLLFALLFGGHWPKPVDWAAFCLLILAVLFLARAEIKQHRA